MHIAPLLNYISLKSNRFETLCEGVTRNVVNNVNPSLRSHERVSLTLKNSL